MADPYGNEPDPETTVTGLAKSVATGLRGGLEGLAGAGGDLFKWEREKAAKIAQMLGADPETVEAIRTYGDENYGLAKGVDTIMGIDVQGVPDTAAVQGKTDAAVKALPQGGAEAVQGATRYQPQTTAEEFAQTAGSFLPAAVAPGSAGARLARVAIPSTATETAGQVTRQLAPEMEDAVRMVVGLVSSIGTDPSAMSSFRARRAVQAVKSDRQAVARLRQLLEEQGMSPEDAVTRIESLQPGGMAIDTGPNVRQEGQRIQARGGEGRAILDPALRERQAGADTRLDADVTDVVGPRLQPSPIQQALEERMAAGGRKQQAAHPEQVQPVDAQSIIDDIDSALGVEKDSGMRSILRDIRDSLHLRGTDELDPSSEGLLSARRAVRNRLYKPDGSIRDNLGVEEAGMLKDYYRKINEAMDAANPTLREADAEIAQAGKEKDAFKTGQEIFENRRGDPTEVEFADTFNAMSPGEQAHVLKGLNVETWRQLGISRSNLQKLQDLVKGDGKWNQQKVAAVVGDDAAQQLMDAISRERTFQETHQKVVQGSKTAETVSGGGSSSGLGGALFDIGVGAGAGGFGGAFGAALSHGRRWLTNRGNRVPSPKADASMARLLTGSSDELQQAVELANRYGRHTPLGAALAAMLARRQEQEAGQ